MKKRILSSEAIAREGNLDYTLNMDSPNYLNRLPASHAMRGCSSDGEIEILDIAGEDSDLGIVFEDDRLVFVRDAVRFPNGATGTYLRLFHQGELMGGRGAVMVPIWNRQVVFVRIFRHATRSWEWELPRGFHEPGLTDEGNARKEILEELGVPALRCDFLADIHPDTGILASTVAVYEVELASNPENASPEIGTEAIQRSRCIRFSELREFTFTAPVRCSYSLAALWLWQSRPEDVGTIARR